MRQLSRGRAARGAREDETAGNQRVAERGFAIGMRNIEFGMRERRLTNFDLSQQRAERAVGFIVTGRLQARARFGAVARSRFLNCRTMMKPATAALRTPGHGQSARAIAAWEQSMERVPK